MYFKVGIQRKLQLLQLITIFWNVMPYILIGMCRRFRRSCRLFTLMAVAVNSTHHHIRADGYLHIDRYENLRTYCQITAFNCNLTQPKLRQLNIT
jgi:hypothetical protein